MSELLARTVPLSFAAAISPLVLMGILAILGGAEARLRGVAYTVGVVATTVLLIGLGLVVVEVQSAATGGGPFASPWAKGVTGLLLIALAVQMARPQRATAAERAEHHHRRLVRPDSPAVAFLLLGAVLMIVNVSTIVVLIAILRNVAEVGAARGDDVVAMAVVTAVTTVPAWGPLVLVLAAGQGMADRIGRLGQWTNRNARYILSALFLVFGLQDLLAALGR